MKRYRSTQHYFFSKKSNAGFSLVELSIAITILFILTAVVYFSYYAALDKVDIAQAKAEMAQITKAIILAEAKTGKPLRGLKGATSAEDLDCDLLDTACYYDALETSVPPGPPPVDLRGSGGAACRVKWQIALNTIKLNVQGLIDFNPSLYLTDPWGSPYMLRVNDGCHNWFHDKNVCAGNPPSFWCAMPGVSCCQADDLFSVGPDGLEKTADDFTFGNESRPHISVGRDGIAGNADDDLRGLLPRAFTGSCTVQGTGYCEGYP